MPKILSTVTKNAFKAVIVHGELATSTCKNFWLLLQQWIKIGLRNLTRDFLNDRLVNDLLEIWYFFNLRFLTKDEGFRGLTTLHHFRPELSKQVRR